MKRERLPVAELVAFRWRSRKCLIEFVLVWIGIMLPSRPHREADTPDKNADRGLTSRFNNGPTRFGILDWFR